MTHGAGLKRELEEFFGGLTSAVQAGEESRRGLEAGFQQEVEQFLGELASEAEAAERRRRGLEVALQRSLGDFFGGLIPVLNTEEECQRRAALDLERDLAGMFGLLEPTIAAATVAVGVMEKRAREEQDRRTGRRFSALDLVRTQELDLSRIFSKLLDPAGDHSQGDLFLSLLLEELNSAPKWTNALRNFRPPGGNNSHVEIESPTGPICIPTEQKKLSGSVDIVIHLDDNRWIGIENKPAAPDQPWQVDRYLIHLSKAIVQGEGNTPEEPLQQDRQELLQNLLLLYWSGDGSDPKLDSLKSWPKIRQEQQKRLRERCLTVPYRGERFGPPSVEGWLTRCHVECRAERVRVFLHDLIDHIRRGYNSRSN